MRPLTLAVTQFAMTWDLPANLDAAETLVRQAAARGAQVVLIPELFAAPYFCKTEEPRHFALAAPAEGNPLLARFADLARDLGVVLPVSFFERAGTAYFNSLAMIDADGRTLGLYRKSHIPQGPGYREKYYFSPGDTGLRVWETAAGRIGAGICWDQWFPEAARAMALAGAEVLLYPSAIGSEPADPDWDSAAHWRRTMQGHAAANILPLAAANRVGAETAGDGTAITFYGTGFVADGTGAVVADAGRGGTGIAAATLDLDLWAGLRASWGLFRDRRPDLYGRLMSLDGARP